MKPFYIIIGAPTAGSDRLSSGAAQNNRIYDTLSSAKVKAQEYAAKSGRGMLVLKVVAGYEPASPPIRPIKISR